MGILDFVATVALGLLAGGADGGNAVGLAEASPPVIILPRTY